MGDLRENHDQLGSSIHRNVFLTEQRIHGIVQIGVDTLRVPLYHRDRISHSRRNEILSSFGLS